ncbi:peroxisomal membrane protein pex14 [Clydaea vesicula]|uniref:Peroxisomal membrane protein PEX14 n=1 Tax=Clydaea vesicula TaxID=447962 RepID=A0AAD5U5S5_9FUNG|nr:peroxisomal membrane protein pex14 [Clydaea vesicula]KAJ3391403.1 peroxisomal membrane protein pex14 [Lobulomyces angularis]
MSEEKIQSAVRFLKDPKVQSAPLTKRIAFLESKGLSSDEIQLALQQVNNNSTNNSGNLSNSQHPPFGQNQPQAQQVYLPQPASYDWKDYVLGTISVVGAGYLTFQFFHNYILPLVSWPNQSQLKDSTEQIDKQLMTSTKTLEAVQLTTSEMMKAVKIQSESVSKSLANMEEVLEELKNNDEKREEDLKDLKSEIELIREVIPKMMDKSKDSQTAVLTDLQDDIKSLKNLLVNRRIPFSNNSSVPSPSQSLPNGLSANNDTVSDPGVRSPVTVSSKLMDSPAKPFQLSSKPSIPAWQLSENTNVSQSEKVESSEE